MADDGAPLLRVQDARFEFVCGRRSIVAVNDLCFEVSSGQRLGIIGPSGCGKSTLARLLVGLLRPQQGSVSFAGDVLHRLSRSQLRARRSDMQLMFQDSWGALDPRYDAKTTIEAPLRIHGRPRRGVAESLADWVHLPRDRLGCRPPQLSGGERQRVALARALALRPRLLVLDEPLTGLDGPVAASLRRRIVELQAELQTTLVWITHDLREVDTVADTVAVMDGGRFVEMGRPAAVLTAPQHATTRALVEARRLFDRSSLESRIEFPAGAY